VVILKFIEKWMKWNATLSTNRKNRPAFFKVLPRSLVLLIAASDGVWRSYRLALSPFDGGRFVHFLLLRDHELENDRR
jgi:hypothetical protein